VFRTACIHPPGAWRLRAAPVYQQWEERCGEDAKATILTRTGLSVASESRKETDSREEARLRLLRYVDI